MGSEMCIRDRLRKGSEALGIILDSDFGKTGRPKVVGVVRGERVEWVY